MAGKGSGELPHIVARHAALLVLHGLKICLKGEDGKGGKSAHDRFGGFTGRTVPALQTWTWQNVAIVFVLCPSHGLRK